MKRNTTPCLSCLCIAAACMFWTVGYSYGQISAKISASKSQITAACGTAKIKVVFLNQNALYYVDFSETDPQIRKMNITGAAYFPVISGDGQWIAYQTANDAEGPSSNPVSGKAWMRELAIDGSPIKIADTGYVPRFVQNTSADTPGIIYSTSLACPLQVCYTDGQTLKKKIVNKIAQQAEVVFDKGSYYGGLSWNNRYLSTAWPGGTNAFMLDLQNGAGVPRGIHTMRVKKTGTDADTFVTVGACNISRSASRVFTNAMLYYDFSSSAIKAANCYHPLLGTWKEHEKLFISRYDAEDLRVYDTPADRPIVPLASANGLGEAVAKEWNNPEWSNHPYYAVAGLLVDRLYAVAGGGWDHTYNSESIYLVNLKDSLYVKLIESTDTSYTSAITFGYPFVWVELASGFQEDTTWLAKTIWERAVQGVIHPIKGALRSIPASLFSSQTGIAVYSVSGQKLAVISSTRDNPIIIREKLRTLKSGIYIFRNDGTGGKEQMYRWLKAK